MSESNIAKPKKSIVGSLMLLLTAIIWGLAFVAQSEGSKHIGAFTFNSIRFMIGFAVLVPSVAFLDRLKGSERRLFSIRERRLDIDVTRREIIGGALCGVVLCIASVLQQLGVEMIGSGKSGFLTSVYVVIVPILGIFLRKRVRLSTWGGVAAALVGVYLISVAPGDGFSIGLGEIYVILSSLVFAIHIIIIDHITASTDGVRVSMIQFGVAALVALPFMLAIDRPGMSDILSAALPLVYAGAFSCGCAYTLQIVGQSRTDPTVASLIMSLESVFSVIGGALILGEVMSGREYIGCAVVFAAVIFTNFLEGRSEKKSK